MKRGKYELKKRAERQEETRLRIARAALELHESVGPALTTRSAIAERAGVGRPTVYAHFPDDLSLGLACSSLGLTENPLPDPGPWEEISDPEKRLRTALGELYGYFRRREGLLANIQRAISFGDWGIGAGTRLRRGGTLLDRGAHAIRRLRRACQDHTGSEDPHLHRRELVGAA